MAKDAEGKRESELICNCTWTVGPHVKQEGWCPQTIPENEICNERGCGHYASRHERKNEAHLHCTAPGCKCERFQAVISTYQHRYAKRKDIPIENKTGWCPIVSYFVSR